MSKAFLFFLSLQKYYCNAKNSSTNWLHDFVTRQTGCSARHHEWDHRWAQLHRWRSQQRDGKNTWDTGNDSLTDNSRWRRWGRCKGGHVTESLVRNGYRRATGHEADVFQVCDWLTFNREEKAKKTTKHIEVAIQKEKQTPDVWPLTLILPVCRSQRLV